MDTLALIDQLLKIVDEIVIPAVALWIAYQIRRWIRGDLEVPPYEHQVTLRNPAGLPPPVGVSVPHAPASPIDHHAHR